jgi:ABC-type amino acid transport substrate-binding protein
MKSIGRIGGSALKTASLFRIFAAALVFVCLSAALGSAADKPQNAGRDIVGQSYDQIVERGWILFGVYEDFRPYSWDDNGTLRGIDVDLGRLIGEALGVEARFRAVGADETVDDDLRNNVWKGHYIGGKVVNVMLHVPYNRELALRNELVVMNGQYFNERVAIAFRQDVYTENPPVPAYFRYDKVAVENDSISDFYLSTLAGGQIVPNMVRFARPEDAMAALNEGQVPAVMGARSQLEFGADEGVRVYTPPLPGLAVGEWTLGMAVRHTYRQLGYAVDDAVRAAVEDGRVEAIFKKYGLSYAKPVW